MHTRSRLAAQQEEEATTSRSASPTSVSLQQKGVDPRTPPSPDVRLYHRAVVVAQVIIPCAETHLLLQRSRLTITAHPLPCN